METPFEYQKVLFRRPFWQPDSRRMIAITAGVAAATLFILFFFINYIEHLPARAISQKIEKNYARFLAEIKFSALPSAEPEPSPRAFLPIRRNLIADAVSHARPLTPPGDSFTSDSLQMAAFNSLQPVTAAIAKVPSLIGEPVFEKRIERQLLLNDNSYLNEHADGPIQIPRPESFQFASTNGRRDLQETTAVMNINEEDIRYCIEKFTRYNPAYSGDVLISFTIHPDGHVLRESIKIIRSSIRDARILHCIRKSISRWKNFPRIALDDGNFTITRKYIY